MIRLTDLMKKIARRQSNRYKNLYSKQVIENERKDNFDYLVSFDAWCDENKVKPLKERAVLEKALNTIDIKEHSMEYIIQWCKQEARAV